jgi:multisubunit Na+/H+ antiporter MnhB subunit
VTGIVASVGFAAPALAADPLDPCTLDPTLCQGRETNVNNVIKNIINVLLFVIGAVAVIVIIVAGIRYTTSGGNSNSVAAAKNTLLYAVIGLVVAVFAYAIVNFVIQWT